MKTSRHVKIVVYVPETHADIVRTAMGDAGAGHIGNYRHCSFSSLGQGRFVPHKGAHPAIGSVGKIETIAEERIEMICAASDAKSIIVAMKVVHPYEEVAYEIYPMLEL